MKLVRILQELGDSTALSWGLERVDDQNIDFYVESRSDKVEGYLVTLALEEDFGQGIWELSFKEGESEYDPSAYYQLTNAREVVPLLKAVKQIVEYSLDPEAWLEGGKEAPNIKAILIAPTSDKRSRVYYELLRKTSWPPNIEVRKEEEGIVLVVK